MATSNYFFQQNSQHGIIQRNGLNSVESGINYLKQNFGTMNAMLSGPSTIDASYTEIVTRYGYPDNATARAAYNEMNSVMGALTGINATLTQAFDRFR